MTPADLLRDSLAKALVREENMRDERDDALAWHTVASAERDELRLRADRYRRDITQIVKALELDPLEVDIPDIIAAVRALRARVESLEETVTSAKFWGGR